MAKAKPKPKIVHTPKQLALHALLMQRRTREYAEIICDAGSTSYPIFLAVRQCVTQATWLANGFASAVPDLDVMRSLREETTAEAKAGAAVIEAMWRRVVQAKGGGK